MAHDDQKRWDEKHASEQGDGSPSLFLQEIFQSHSWRIQPGRALDIATGEGRFAEGAKEAYRAGLFGQRVK